MLDQFNISTYANTSQITNYTTTIETESYDLCQFSSPKYNHENNLTYSEVAEGLQEIGKSLTTRFFSWVKSFLPSLKINKDIKHPQDTLKKLAAAKKSIDEDTTKKLTKEIVTAVQDAKSEGLPLMLLMGENHISSNSAKHEIQILDIAYNQLGMTTILSEPFFTNCYSDMVWYGVFLSSTSTLPFYKTEIFVNERNMTKIPIDFPACFAPHYFEKFKTTSQQPCAFMANLLGNERALYYSQNVNNKNLTLDTITESMISHEMMALRDEAMAEISIQMKKRKNIVDLEKVGVSNIVGADHLSGLQQRLTNEFFLLSFDLSDKRKFDKL